MSSLNVKLQLFILLILTWINLSTTTTTEKTEFQIEYLKNEYTEISQVSKLILQSQETSICSGINCREEPVDFVSGKCPVDSVEVVANKLQRICCGVEKICVCGECDDLKATNKWCKLAGDSFEATLVEKGRHRPGKCCDIHICHSTNLTCHFNGKFYPHKFSWKIDECTECSCELGYISCTKIDCPSLECEVKTVPHGQCCPICTGQCMSLSSKSPKYYYHNELWNDENDPCITCKCLNGKKSCLTESCEVAPCKNPVKIVGECCSSCPTKNQCLHKCKNSTICEGGLFKKDHYGCLTCECKYIHNVSESSVFKWIWSEYIRKISVYSIILATVVMSSLLFSIILLVYRTRCFILGRKRNGSYSCKMLTNKLKKNTDNNSIILDGSYRNNRNQNSSSPLLKTKINNFNESSGTCLGLETDRSRVLEL